MAAVRVVFQIVPAVAKVLRHIDCPLQLVIGYRCQLPHLLLQSEPLLQVVSFIRNKPWSQRVSMRLMMSFISSNRSSSYF